MTLYLEYMRLDEFIGRFHPENPKLHDITRIRASLDYYGFVEAPTLDEKTGMVAAGHGRGKSLWQDMQAGKALPTDIEIDADGMWKLPVVRGKEFATEQDLLAYLAVSNQLTMAGGWDIPKLQDIMVNLQDTPLFELTGFDAGMLGDMGISLGDAPELPDDFKEYNESIVDDVEMCECPNCGHKFPK